MTRSVWSIIAVLVGAFVFAFGGTLVADSITGQTPALAGDPGGQGRAGANGANGSDGADGADGADGSPGTPGLPGAVGPQGAKGSTGDTGAPGAPGAPGVDGATGAQGPAGADGAPGSDGAPGAPGAQGDTGMPGLDGSDGPRSYAVIVDDPPVVFGGAGNTFLATLDAPEGTWIVSAGWHGMNTNNDGYGCWLTNSQFLPMYPLLNSEAIINSYSMTQVFAAPEGSTFSLMCFAFSPFELNFSQVTLSAIEVTG